MNYFENCKTVEELKETYKKLALKFHPDVYGEKGNEIMKEIHKQLETATKNIDKAYYAEFNNVDRVETPETRARKEELSKEAKTADNLFVLYWMNRLRPSNHRNPLTKHNFSGGNIWELELQMLLKGYTSCEWSTFPQIKADENSVLKGEKGTQITLAVVYDKKDKDGNKTDEKGTYYKAYTVFNMEQTAKGLSENAPKQIQGAVLKDVEIEEAKPKQVKSTANNVLLDKWEQQNLFKIA